MHPAVLLERTVVGIVHAHLVPDRAQDRLLGEGMGTELEGDLVHQNSPVPATCLKVPELASTIAWSSAIRWSISPATSI